MDERPGVGGVNAWGEVITFTDDGLITTAAGRTDNDQVPFTVIGPVPTHQRFNEWIRDRWWHEVLYGRPFDPLDAALKRTSSHATT